MQQAAAIDWTDHLVQFHEIVRHRGMHVRVGTDFRRFKRLARETLDKHNVNPAFDPDRCDLSDGNAFWITGHADDGSLVHMQAMRCFDTAGAGFADYLRTNLDIMRIGGYAIDPDATEIYMTRAAAAMAGRITYHGELWIKGGPQGFRGGCMVAVLTRLAMVTALRKWSPDFMFGFQSPMTSCRGLACREGYAHIEQRSVLWHRLDGKPPLEDWLVWMSREEAEFNLRLPPDYIVDLFEGDAAEPAPQLAVVAGGARA